MSGVKKKYNRVRKGTKTLSQHDQIKLFLAAIQRAEGNNIFSVVDFEKALDDYSSYKNHDKITLRAFNKDFDENCYKGEIRKYHPELEGIEVFYDFVKCLRFNTEYPWDEEYFSKIIEYTGQFELAETAKSEPPFFKLSSPKIDFLVNRPFCLYVPRYDIVPDNPDKLRKVVGVDKAKVRFTSLIEVELLMFDSNLNEVIAKYGRYKFINNDNYLILEFYNEKTNNLQFQFIFNTNSVNMIDPIFGQAMNFSSSAKPILAILGDSPDVDFHPAFYKIEEKTKEIPFYVSYDFGIKEDWAYALELVLAEIEIETRGNKELKVDVHKPVYRDDIRYFNIIIDPKEAFKKMGRGTRYYKLAIRFRLTAIVVTCLIFFLPSYWPYLVILFSILFCLSLYFKKIGTKLTNDWCDQYYRTYQWQKK